MRTALAALAGLTAVSVAHAGTTFTSDIVAGADGAVQFSGALGYTVVDNDANQMSRSGGNNVRNSVWEFSLASVPAGATITGATLRLETAGLVSNVGATAQFDFFVNAGDGAVTDGDHENLAGPSTLSASETYATSSAGPLVGTVLDIVFTDLAGLQALVDANEAWASVRGQTFNFATLRTKSLETTDSTAVVPTLVVEYIPTPGAAAMLGLAGAFGLRRRRA